MKSIVFSHHILRGLFLIPLIFFLSVSMAYAGEEKTINFVEEANWPPFTPDYSGNTEEGLAYELMRVIFDELDIQVSLKLLPMSRVLKSLQSGKADGVTVISKNVERESYLLFSTPIFNKNGLIYYNQDKLPGFKWSSFEDLKGYRIGIVQGHNYGDAFTKAIQNHNLNIQIVISEEQNFLKLFFNRVDIILSIDLVAKKIISQKNFGDKIHPASKPYFTKPYHIGISKNSEYAPLIPEINSVILEAQKDNKIKDLIAVHLNSDEN